MNQQEQHNVVWETFLFLLLILEGFAMVVFLMVA